MRMTLLVFIGVCLISVPFCWCGEVLAQPIATPINSSDGVELPGDSEQYVVLKAIPSVEGLQADGIIPMAEEYVYDDWSGSMSIPDGPFGSWVGVSLEPLGAPEGAYVSKVQVHHVITHPYIGDLSVKLTNELTSHLWMIRNKEGGSLDNIDETKVEELIFDGDDPNQIWYYAVKDNYGGDTGTLNEVELWVYYELGPGEIHGMKFDDLDGDGEKDDGEPGLENWFIYLDTNSNGLWETIEPNTLTGSDGSYAFADLAPGDYIVAEVQQEGWNQTYPEILGGGAESLTTTATPGPTTYGDLLSEEERQNIGFMIIDSPPHPPIGVIRPVAITVFAEGDVMLSQVPTSTWTYGCTATSAGMIFGYYDRTVYPDMYTGPANDGVAPLTDLGQGIYTPIPGSCSIIATQNGFDGRTTKGHVNDYWISYGSAGPDPFEGIWTEHTWGDCTADYLGTNQWKWDDDVNGFRDFNIDGGTRVWYWPDGSKMYDYIPPADMGLPQTACCHGLRLFAESRGYTVVENYTQMIDTLITGGFSFAEYMAEIDAQRPVMIHLDGHTIVGVGYNEATETVYLHDTWDNSVHPMTWGGSYSGMEQQLVTVLILEPVAPPGTHAVTLESGQVLENINFGNHQDIACGDWGYLPADADQNCTVDIEDFAILASQWLADDCASTANCSGADMDIDGPGPDEPDGVVDLRDFSRLFMDWLLCTDPEGVDCYNLLLPCGSWGYYLGDIDRDCRVDALDLAELAAQWRFDGLCTELGNDWCNHADTNEDGSVNLEDFVQLVSDWLLCTDPADPIQCSNLFGE